MNMNHVAPVKRHLCDERAEMIVSYLANWSLTTHQISVQSVHPFPQCEIFPFELPVMMKNFGT